MTIYKIAFFLFLLTQSAFTKAQSNEDKKAKPEISNTKTIENKLSFRDNLNNDKLEYQIKPISDGHFKLIFINTPSEYVGIKIYDIIGNLILSEKTKYSINSEIEYNFNKKNNKIYVVKVESGEENLIKKINF